MQFARPRKGFNIVVVPNVEVLVENAKAEWDGFSQHWDNIIDRLKFVAHREGVLDNRLGNGYFLFVAEELPSTDIPRVLLIYLILGDTVTIKLARIG